MFASKNAIFNRCRASSHNEKMQNNNARLEVIAEVASKSTAKHIDAPTTTIIMFIMAIGTVVMMMSIARMMCR